MKSFGTSMPEGRSSRSLILQANSGLSETLTLPAAKLMSEYRVWVTSPRRNPVYNANRMASFSSSSARARMRLRNLIEYFCFAGLRSEEHTSELQSRQYLVCRLLLEKKKIKQHL